jgi:hypothetical protein
MSGDKGYFNSFLGSARYDVHSGGLEGSYHLVAYFQP